MKLIVKDHRTEGQIQRSDAYIVFGWNKPNGWYMTFSCPFIVREIDDYMDRQYFETRHAWCYPRCGVRVQRPRGHKWYRVQFMRFWEEVQ